MAQDVNIETLRTILDGHDGEVYIHCRTKLESDVLVDALRELDFSTSEARRFWGQERGCGIWYHPRTSPDGAMKYITYSSNQTPPDDIPRFYFDDVFPRRDEEEIVVSPDFDLGDF